MLLPEITPEEREYRGDPLDRKALMAHKKVRLESSLLERDWRWTADGLQKCKVVSLHLVRGRWVLVQMVRQVLSSCWGLGFRGTVQGAQYRGSYSPSIPGALARPGAGAGGC